MEERYDDYDELKEQIFKMWSIQKPQIVLTQEEWANIKDVNVPQIDCNWFI